MRAPHPEAEITNCSPTLFIIIKEPSPSVKPISQVKKD